MARALFMVHDREFWAYYWYWLPVYLIVNLNDCFDHELWPLKVK